MRLTLNSIAREIAKRGGKEILVKGNGYFYFAEGEAAAWYSSSVYVYRLSDYTLDQWIDEWEMLRKPR
jgi:hypothetical protein